MPGLLTSASDIDLKLGQSPPIQDPLYAVEFQKVYNALHLLGQYMGAISTAIESSDGQTPDVSLRFRFIFWGIALQDIVAGAIVSSVDTGVQKGIVNGVASTAGPGPYYDQAASLGSTGDRRMMQSVGRPAWIALSNATAGQQVQVGVGPGITRIEGAVCGQLIWAVAAQSISSYRNTGDDPNQFFIGRSLVNNGGIYLNNVTAQYNFPSGGGYNWEGYWLPGFPQNNGGTLIYDRAFLHPVGVCVTNGYVMFKDYVRSDPRPHSFGLGLE